MGHDLHEDNTPGWHDENGLHSWQRTLTDARPHGRLRFSRIDSPRTTIINLFSVAREVRSHLHSSDPRSTDSRSNEPGPIRFQEHADHFVIRRVDQTSPVRVEQLPLRTRITIGYYLCSCQAFISVHVLK